MNKILICVAHPDDETIGCGGTIRKHFLNKDKIYCLSLTDGVSARKNSSDKKIREREKNSFIAAKILGFNWVREKSKKFMDNRLDDVNLLDIIKHIEIVKKKINPNLIFTHNSTDLNIDHRKVFESVITAFRPQPKESWEKIYTFEIPSATDYRNLKNIKSFQPNSYVDISKTWVSKFKALKAYKSEIKKEPHSRSLGGIKTLAKLRGYESGTKMAEAFELVKELKR